MKNILFTLVFLFFNAELSAQNFSGSWGYEIADYVTMDGYTRF